MVGEEGFEPSRGLCSPCALVRNALQHDELIHLSQIINCMNAHHCELQKVRKGP